MRLPENILAALLLGAALLFAPAASMAQMGDAGDLPTDQQKAAKRSDAAKGIQLANIPTSQPMAKNPAAQIGLAEISLDEIDPPPLELQRQKAETARRCRHRAHFHRL